MATAQLSPTGASCLLAALRRGQPRKTCWVWSDPWTLRAERGPAHSHLTANRSPTTTEAAAVLPGLRTPALTAASQQKGQSGAAEEEATPVGDSQVREGIPDRRSASWLLLLFSLGGWGSVSLRRHLSRVGPLPGVWEEAWVT